MTVLEILYTGTKEETVMNIEKTDPNGRKKTKREGGQWRGWEGLTSIGYLGCAWCFTYII